MSNIFSLYSKEKILLRNMRYLILLLLGLCLTPATLRPSQTDDDDGQDEEAEEGADDGDDGYIQEEALKSDNKRSYDDQAEKADDYTEPDSEDPALENNRMFPGDQKISSREVSKEDINAETVKEEAIPHEKSNVYKRTSHTEESVPTPDVTIKDKFYKLCRDQNRDKFDVKEEAQKNKETLTQMHELAGKVSNEKLENVYDRNYRETYASTSAEIARKRSNERKQGIGTFDTSDIVHKKNKKYLSRRDLEDLLSSLSLENVNILKTLINDIENVAKRDTEKKPNTVDGDKSTDNSRINVRENQEKFHSSVPSTCDSELPHNIHSLNTCPPTGCVIKIPNPNEMCNLTTPHVELTDTNEDQDKTQSKEIKFMDDTLTDIMDMKNDNKKETDMSDLVNIANLHSFYDFSEHRNNYKDNVNSHTDDYSELHEFDSKLLKRDNSRAKHAEASMEPLEDSFPRGYEKFNSGSDLEPLVRVKRTEGQKYLTENSKQTCKNAQNGEMENMNYATDKMSIGSDADNILSNNESDLPLMYDKSSGKRAHDKILESKFHDTRGTDLGDEMILGDNDKLALMIKETGSQDTEVDGLENMTELKDVNRYKRIRQTNEEID